MSLPCRSAMWFKPSKQPRGGEGRGGEGKGGERGGGHFVRNPNYPTNNCKVSIACDLFKNACFVTNIRVMGSWLGSTGPPVQVY